MKHTNKLVGGILAFTLMVSSASLFAAETGAATSTKTYRNGTQIKTIVKPSGKGIKGTSEGTENHATSTKPHEKKHVGDASSTEVKTKPVAPKHVKPTVTHKKNEGSASSTPHN